MPPQAHLVLPDRWRVELLREPAERDAWLTALDAHPTAQLVDWASARPRANELVIVAGLDIAAAELVLKLPPEVPVFAADTWWARLPVGGQAQLLKRAWRRVQHRLVVPHRTRNLPPSPVTYLATLLRAAGVSR